MGVNSITLLLGIFVNVTSYQEFFATYILHDPDGVTLLFEVELNPWTVILGGLDVPTRQVMLTNPVLGGAEAEACTVPLVDAKSSNQKPS